ncbi:MAG TPA: hypothetical protein VGX23_36695 [Actinocrinis sp.]|nr:hypothetical protein [Actinocrinis sp.]
MELRKSTLDRRTKRTERREGRREGRRADQRAEPRPDRRSDSPPRLLRDNPVLLLNGPRTPPTLYCLLQAWNPTIGQDAEGDLQIADAVTWHGPFLLDPALAGEADLPDSWSIAYAARSPRQRVRIQEGRNAPDLRLRYPKDLPAGSEALAWSLVSGLARRLHGAARLPGGPAHTVTAAETAYCVYGNEALPWQVLRSVLELAVPDLSRNGALAPNDYCLERPGDLEVEVRPIADGEFVPYALQSKPGDGWPGTLYRFACVPPGSDAELVKSAGRCLEAALLLSDVIGGVLLDGDGFPVPGP